MYTYIHTRRYLHTNGHGETHISLQDFCSNITGPQWETGCREVGMPAEENNEFCFHDLGLRTTPPYWYRQSQRWPVLSGLGHGIWWALIGLGALDHIKSGNFLEMSGVVESTLESTTVRNRGTWWEGHGHCWIIHLWKAKTKAQTRGRLRMKQIRRIKLCMAMEGRKAQIQRDKLLW